MTFQTMPEYQAWDRLSALCVDLFGSDDASGLRKAIARVALSSGQTQSEVQRLPFSAFIELLAGSDKGQETPSTTSAAHAPPAPLASAGGDSAASPPIFNATRGILQLENRPVCLECNEQDVLGVLVRLGATTLQVLRKESNCDNPNRVLTGLIRKYALLKKHIFLPGGKGHGGYSTTIRLAK